MNYRKAKKICRPGALLTVEGTSHVRRKMPPSHQKGNGCLLAMHENRLQPPKETDINQIH